MDPLSVTASVIAVCQLANEVIQYLNDVKDAPKECQQCIIEVSSLLGPLYSLRFRAEQAEKAQTVDPWFEQLRRLNVRDGPLDQYRQALELLRSKTEPGDGIQKVKRRLFWKFNKEEVKSILERMERLKSLVTIALEMDHTKLSEAIKEDTAFIRASLPPLQASAAAIEAGISTLQLESHSVRDNRAHQEAVKWLSSMDFSSQQNDIISRRQEGTAQWFLDSAEFKAWLQGPDKTLFCPGIPGAGKTMMASVAIDHLYRTTRSTDTGVAYIFCSYKAQLDQQQSALDFLAAILQQLVQGRPDISDPVMFMKQTHSARQTRPSLNDLTKALLSVCSSYTNVYVVVDALDECSDSNRARSQLISSLHGLQAQVDLRLLMTSRFIPEVEQHFRTKPWLEVRASEEDVRRYVVGQIPRLPNCIRRDIILSDILQKKIVEAVDGMFLLARLHVDSLLDKRTKQRVLATLDKLSKGSEALNDAYGEAIKRIEGQLEEDRQLAKRAICWISYAKRLLRTEELCTALAIEPGSKSLDMDNIYEVEDIISLCAGLVSVDEERGIIRLVHYTTQEYFERERLSWNPGGQEDIALTCLTHLSFSEFESGVCDSRQGFFLKVFRYQLLEYLVDYWAGHVREVESCTSVLDFALSFLNNEALTDFVTKLEHFRYHSQDHPAGRKGLHCAAQHGLVILTIRFLDGGSSVNAIQQDMKDNFGNTALMLAAENGHEVVVAALLASDKVSDGDLRNVYGQTALMLAAENGHEVVVAALLASDKVLDGDLRNVYGQTALMLALENGHEVMVAALLASDKISAGDSGSQSGRTALILAAAYGHEAAVKLLLDSDKISDGDLSDKYGDTALIEAAQFGQEAIVKLLLASDKVKDCNARGQDQMTALCVAADYGHKAVVKALLGSDKFKHGDKGISCDCYSALTAARRARYKAIVTVLQDAIATGIHGGQFTAYKYINTSETLLALDLADAERTTLRCTELPIGAHILERSHRAE